LVSIFEAHEKQIFSVGINPKGTLCVSGGRDKKLNFWSIEENGLKLLTSIVTSEFISAIEFINDEMLAVGLGNGIFQVSKIFFIPEPRSLLT
jgi:WD40 repeat protein